MADTYYLLPILYTIIRLSNVVVRRARCTHHNRSSYIVGNASRTFTDGYIIKYKTFKLSGYPVPYIVFTHLAIQRWVRISRHCF